MGDTFSHPNFSVVDDFLSEEKWTELWSAFQFMDLLPVSRTHGAWKLDDGVPLAGAECVLDRSGNSPENTKVEPPVQTLLRAVLKRADLQENHVAGAWDRIVGRPYVYPKDTSLSWHVDDHELYAGAFIYYAHPVWNAHFGGELLIAETDGAALPIMGYRFETEPYSDALLEVGCGNFIMPKPNRLVVLSGAPHMVAKVSAAAGHHVRASVAGFFLRPKADSLV
ncbi:MAG TPA: 2OG-Fe(II) oxygenase [Polyangiaceae bacterium]|nr:2OG-Fe(II) oxygenase [Polyangiaceae bacterium]